jgi:hypothetical protein
MAPDLRSEMAVGWLVSTRHYQLRYMRRPAPGADRRQEQEQEGKEIRDEHSSSNGEV